MGKPELVMEIAGDSNFEDLIAVIIERYGEKFEKEVGSSLKESFNRNFNIYLRGRLIYPSKYSQTKLQDQDEVTIIQPVGGG